jgi:hypothetical protein
VNDICIEDEVLNKFDNFNYDERTDLSNRKSIIHLSGKRQILKDNDSHSCTSYEFKNGKIN